MKRTKKIRTILRSVITAPFRALALMWNEMLDT